MTEESENRKVLTSCPAHAYAIGEKCKIYSFISKGECPLTPSSIPCGIVELSHTPPLCFATQNIGEVSAGLENAGSGGDRVRFPLPLLIVNETGGNARKVKGLASTT